MNFARDISDRVVFVYNEKIWETGHSNEVFQGNFYCFPKLNSFLSKLFL
jgi:polar amino acid transport system ATP-binding protein